MCSCRGMRALVFARMIRPACSEIAESGRRFFFFWREMMVLSFVGNLGRRLMRIFSESELEGSYIYSDDEYVRERCFVD